MNRLTQIATIGICLGVWLTLAWLVLQ